VAVVAAALLLSACGSGIDPDAITVGPSRVGRSSLDDELQALAANKEFARFVKQRFSVDIAPTPRTLAPEMASQWVNARLNQAVIDREFRRRKLKVTSRLRADGKAAAESSFGGAGAFAAFPQWFREEQVERQARLQALAEVAPPFRPSEKDLRRFFENRVSKSCQGQQLVSQILVPTQAEAEEIAAMLANGADFATLARERSTDPASKNLGGALWCGLSQQLTQVSDQFRLGVSAAARGEPATPVLDQEGYHLIKVSPWTFENVRPLLERDYTQQAETPLGRLVNRLLRDTSIWVDPRFGRAVRVGGTVYVEPPKIPEPKVKPPEPPNFFDRELPTAQP
jgi:hypothetical protein